MLYLGIDGGGTKTVGCLYNEEKEIARFTSGATNPNDRGIDEVRDNLSLIAAGVGSYGKISSVFAGIAGCLNHRAELEGILKELFPTSAVGVDSDASIMLEAGLGERDGCGIICGTGSVLFARENGNVHRIGGWGYLLDGKGSGYDIGRDALSAALREADGRGEKTALTEMIEKREGKRVTELITEIYAKGKTYIASFAPLVFEADAQGDIAAHRIIEENMAYIAELVSAAARYYSDEFPVSLSGGIFLHNPAALECLCRLVTTRARCELCPTESVVGAVRLAMKNADYITNEMSVRNFPPEGEVLSEYYDKTQY